MFNDASLAHREKMTETQRSEQDQMVASHGVSQQANKAMYERHKESLVADETARMAQDRENKMAGPHPDWAPPPPVPTQEQLKPQATHTVSQNHQVDQDRREAAHRIKREDHTRQSLDLPPAQSQYEQRKAAYLQQIKASRERTQDRERGQNR